MKTLDEVIEGFECCENIDCGNCPYKILFNDDSHVPCDQFSKDEDALHYLREYRFEKAMWEADRKGYLNWIEQYKEAREKHQQAVIELKKNPPLTMDELMQMKGKPIWIEPANEWMLITDVDVEDCDIWLLSLDGLDYDFVLHENWQAYRKER